MPSYQRQVCEHGDTCQVGSSESTTRTGHRVESFAFRSRLLGLNMAGCCHANGIVLFDIHGTAVPTIEALKRGVRRLRRTIGMTGRFESRRCLAKIHHLTSWWRPTMFQSINGCCTDALDMRNMPRACATCPSWPNHASSASASSPRRRPRCRVGVLNELKLPPVPYVLIPGISRPRYQT